MVLKRNGRRHNRGTRWLMGLGTGASVSILLCPILTISTQTTIRQDTRIKLPQIDVQWLEYCQESIGVRYGDDDEGGKSFCEKLLSGGRQLYGEEEQHGHTFSLRAYYDSIKRRLIDATSIGGPVDYDPSGFARFKRLEDWINLAMAISFVISAALASGLTIGLLSIDTLELEIKQRVGTQDEIWQAQRILPLLERRHLLLVTLLLFNSVAAEALPLALGELVPGYAAVVISVTMVLFFGEIFPSAIFSGPNQLRLGARMSGVVWCLIAFFFPISYPISRFLDWFLGDENENTKRYNRRELSALIEIHHHKLQQQHVASNNRKSSSAASRRPSSANFSPALAPPPPPPTGVGGGGGPFTGSAVATITGRLLSHIKSTQQQQEECLIPTPLVERGSSLERGKSTIHPASRSSSLLADPSKSDSYEGGRGEGDEAEEDNGGKEMEAEDITSDESQLLTGVEVSLVVGVLNIARKRAKDCLVPWDEIFCLYSHGVLDEETLAVIRSRGYSRIPVCRSVPASSSSTFSSALPSFTFASSSLIVERPASAIGSDEGKTRVGGMGDPRHVCGFLLTKHLITVDAKEKRPIGTMSLRCPIVVSPDCPLIDLLGSFQQGHSHLALVSSNPHLALKRIIKGEPLDPEIAPIGVVTLEDVIEEILQEEILDEKDQSRSLLLNQISTSFPLTFPKVTSATLLRKFSSNRPPSMGNLLRSRTPTPTEQIEMSDNGANNDYSTPRLSSTFPSKIKSCQRQRTSSVQQGEGGGKRRIASKSRHATYDGYPSTGGAGGGSSSAAVMFFSSNPGLDSGIVFPTGNGGDVEMMEGGLMVEEGEGGGMDVRRGSSRSTVNEGLVALPPEKET